MKKRYNLIGLLALALTAGITTSCSDFLTQENKKALTEEQIYSDVEFIELNLKGIYNTWRDNTRQDERAWFLMTGTDEIQRGALQNKGGGEGAAMDRYDANMNSLHSKVKDQWNKRFPIVTAAAKIIHALDTPELVEGSKEAGLWVKPVSSVVSSIMNWLCTGVKFLSSTWISWMKRVMAGSR